MHVEPKPIEKYPWYIRLFFWNQKRRYGKVLVPGLIWARIPSLFAPLSVLYGGIDRKSSAIEPQRRSLLTVRVSQINWCEFCVDMNSATLMKRGCSLEKVEQLPIWRESPLFDKRERVALEYTEAMTCSDQKVSGELMNQVKNHFSDDSLVELTALIAYQNMSSKFNSALAIPPQGFCTKPSD